MKVIQIDGYNRGGPEGNDKLVCGNISKYWGKIVVEFLKKRNGCDAVWFKLVSDSYKLQIFEP